MSASGSSSYPKDGGTKFLPDTRRHIPEDRNAHSPSNRRHYTKSHISDSKAYLHFE
jgi:hypothetical protein